jgi:hypothetical protein
MEEKGDPNAASAEFLCLCMADGRGMIRRGKGCG